MQKTSRASLCEANVYDFLEVSLEQFFQILFTSVSRVFNLTAHDLKCL